MRRLALLVIVPALLWAGEASALKPSRHRSITLASCERAGLPDRFCARAALENYNTDAHEWDDLTAHAQIPEGLDACAGADLATTRAWSLGRELRAALARPVSDDATVAAATALGRAAHELQDSCAHQGMPNIQHAWYSLSDFCDGTTLSPDIQSSAIACAADETDALMGEVAAAIAARGAASWLDARSCPEPDPASDHGGAMRGPCEDSVLPAPWDVCQFLDSANAWDGRDARWDHQRVRPALRAAFLAGLHGAAAPAPLCAAGQSVATRSPFAPVDVSAGPPTCVRAHLLCLGKVDAVEYFDEADDDALASTSGGCRTAPGRTPAIPVFAAAALLLLLARRRRAA